MKRIAFVWMCSIFGAGVVQATTATFNVVPDAASTSTQTTVEPGASVPYDITAIVTPADANDNNGLAAAAVDLMTDFGIVQPEGAREINPVLNTFAEEGLPGDGTDNCDIGDICGIGGSQLIIGTNVVPFANGTVAVIASGNLVAPTAEGTYFVTVTPTSASFLHSDISVFPVSTIAAGEDVKAGGGFTVVVQVATQSPTTPPTTPPPSGGICGAGVGLAMAMSCVSLWLCDPRRRR